MRKPRAAKPEPSPRGMSDQELDRWLYARRSRGPLATNLSMLDGFVTAMAAGPLGLDLLGSISALLAVDKNTMGAAGASEFAAVKAAADRFNSIGEQLQEGTGVQPRYRRKPNGDVDAADWCEGFLAAANLNRAAWKDVLNPTSPLYGLMLPILLHCKDQQGNPMLGPPRSGPETQIFLRDAHRDIPMTVAAIREHYHVTPANGRRHR